MRNATIATSRTRATSDDLIDYRPLPATWGDVESLRAVRAAKARAAEHGLDPSILEIAATGEITATGETPRRHRRPLGSRRSLAARRTPLAPRRLERTTPSRTGRTTGPLAAA